MALHVVRYGLLGHLGRFASVDAVRYPRASRVVLRTGRGLEVGQIVAEPEDRPGWSAADATGQILRRMTVQDELLEARLDRRRHEAFDACSQLLTSRGIDAALVDVEHLLDGEGLFFYFLGDPPREMAEITGELASTYEAAVEFRQFVDTLTEGCGPGCGTEAATGGGCSTCSGCSVASACGTRK